MFTRSATDLALFVEEVEYTPQDGQQQDADNNDGNDNTTALWWRRSTRMTTALLAVTALLTSERASSRIGSGKPQQMQADSAAKKSAALASFR